MIPLIGHHVVGQRLLGEVDRQVLAVQPDRSLLPGQRPLAIDPPVAEADVPELIQTPREAKCQPAIRRWILNVVSM